jgi:hypothetical protein
LSPPARRKVAATGVNVMTLPNLQKKLAIFLKPYIRNIFSRSSYTLSQSRHFSAKIFYLHLALFIEVNYFSLALLNVFPEAGF